MSDFLKNMGVGLAVVLVASLGICAMLIALHSDIGKYIVGVLGVALAPVGMYFIGQSVRSS